MTRNPLRNICNGRIDQNLFADFKGGNDFFAATYLFEFFDRPGLVFNIDHFINYFL